MDFPVSKWTHNLSLESLYTSVIAAAPNAIEDIGVGVVFGPIS